MICSGLAMTSSECWKSVVNRVLVIDCIKRTMPVWAEIATLESYSECTTSELSEVTGVMLIGMDDLDADQRKVMYERYTMIAPVLSFLTDDRMRSRLIGSAAEEHGVSKQTIRGYLCLYLAYMDVTALAPRHREDERVLTQDEKNIRWALNKFFYTMQLARRSLGLRYDVMEYGEDFKMFCEVLYSYQYVRRRTEITDAITMWLYEHTSGNISVVVSLIHDAQETAILNGREALNLESLNEAYQQRLSLLHGFIQPRQKCQTSKAKRKNTVPKVDARVKSDGEFTIAGLVSQTKTEGVDIVELLKNHLPVVEVAV